ncbi:hypothetical protein HDK64DRAFT_329572 [Phyllosticta capitalensis]
MAGAQRSACLEQTQQTTRDDLEYMARLLDAGLEDDAQIQEPEQTPDTLSQTLRDRVAALKDISTEKLSLPHFMTVDDIRRTMSMLDEREKKAQEENEMEEEQAQRGNAILKARAEEFSAQVHESGAERGGLRDQVSTLKPDLSNERFTRAGEQREHAAALSKLRDTLRARDATLDQLTSEIESLEDAINDLMIQNKSLFTCKIHLGISLAKITRDASHLQKELQESKMQFQCAHADRESTEAHNTHAKNDMVLDNEASIALHRAQEDLAATKGELAEKTTYLAEVTTRLMSSQTALSASETKFALLKQTLEEAKHILSFEQSHLAGVIRELETAYADVDNAQASLKNEQQLHKALQSRFHSYFYRLCYWLEEVEKCTSESRQRKSIIRAPGQTLSVFVRA